jgi:hypothetical protein
LPQHLVRQCEWVGQRDTLRDDLQQPIVGDHDDHVDALAQPLDRRRRLLPASSPFESERLAHDAHGNRARLASDLRDDGRGTGAGAAAHPGGDEHHVLPGAERGDRLSALPRRSLTHIRLASGTEAASALGTQLQRLRRERDGERLHVGVHAHELDAGVVLVLEALHHTVHCVAAAAAYPDHLDGALPNRRDDMRRRANTVVSGGGRIQAVQLVRTYECDSEVHHSARRRVAPKNPARKIRYFLPACTHRRSGGGREALSQSWDEIA